MEKLKEFYEAADVEIILFEFSDIVTSSSGAPDPGDVDDGWN